VDERSPAVRARAVARIGGDFEGLAARTIHRFVHAATGDRVVLQDDGSRQSMPDLRVEDRDGTVVGVGEIVTDTAPAYAEALNLIHRRRRPILDSRLRRVWLLTFAAGSSLGRLEAQGPPLLVELEHAGHLFEQPRDFDRPHPPTEVPALHDLGVRALVSSPGRPDGPATGMWLFVDGVTGPAEPDWETFLDWLESTLRRPDWTDVRHKLDDARTQRHVAIGVTLSSPGDVHTALSRDHHGVPSRAPNLPPEMTHVWVMLTMGRGRCLMWSRQDGWVDLYRHRYTLTRT